LVIRFIWLFLFINVYWWGNTTPPTSHHSFSRLNAAQAGFTFLQKGELFLFFWVCEFFFIASTLLLFMLLYLTSYKTDSFYKNFFELYTPMSFKHKLALFCFSVVLAIPVRVWIKTKLPRIVTTAIWFILIYLATILPLVAIFVFFQVVLLVNSLLFVLSYENFPSFKNFICKSLFAGNKTFASLYFDFFWGEHE
jgi:hypothetical protein